MNNFIAILFAFVMSGCVPKTGYGDGRIVKIIVEGDFTSIEHNLIRSAAHSWDELGVRYRMADEPNSDSNDAIHIEPLFIADGSTTGTTWPGVDRISIYVNTIWSWDDGNNPLLFATVVAHEFGHSMGLEHTKNPLARMYYAPTSDNFPILDAAGGDLLEFCRVYPLKSFCVGERNE